MAGFRYRLQSLLDQKIAAKEDAQQALAGRQKEALAERQALESCREERDRVAARIADARNNVLAGAGAGARGNMLHVHRDFVLRLNDDLRSGEDTIRAQELRIAEADDAVDQARRHLADCSREVDMLEKHRERMALEFAKEVDRKEALEQEEMGNIIHLRRRQGS